MCLHSKWHGFYGSLGPGDGLLGDGLERGPQVKADLLPQNLRDAPRAPRHASQLGHVNLY